MEELVKKITRNIENKNINLYELLIDGDPVHIDSKHRKGSTFFRTIVVYISQSDCTEWGIPEKYIGYWQSNNHVWSEDDYDTDELFPFVRVEKKTKEITTIETYYEKV